MLQNKLIILGSSSATPTKERHQSAQYLQFDRHHILIDCGEGTQQRLLEAGISFNKLNYIFISHLHGDHYLGLIGLLNTMGLNSRKNKLTIFGPKGLKKIIDVNFEVSPPRMDYDLIINEHKEGAYTPLKISNLEVEAIPLNHRIPCHGFVFKEVHNDKQLDIDACKKHNVPTKMYAAIKKGVDFQSEKGVILNKDLTKEHPKPLSYAYLSDTAYSENLVSNVKGVGLLYHEATFLHNLLDTAVRTRHSTARQAAKFASQAGVNQLIIGHFSSRYKNLKTHLDEAKSQFENTFLALEGETFYLS